MISFQGHAAWPYGLGGDVIFSLLPLLSICILRLFHLLPKIGKNISFWDAFLIYIHVLFIPNTIYAAFEIKHLFLVDNVADNPNLWSYLVFESISLLGLISAMTIARLVIAHYAKTSSEKRIYALGLGFINGFGVSAGLLDFNSWNALNPLNLVSIALGILLTPQYLYIFLLTFVTFTIIALFITKAT